MHFQKRWCWLWMLLKAVARFRKLLLRKFQLMLVGVIWWCPLCAHLPALVLPYPGRLAPVAPGADIPHPTAAGAWAPDWLICSACPRASGCGCRPGHELGHPGKSASGGFGLSGTDAVGA